MINPMHKEIFDFYLLSNSNLSEKNKRALRKTLKKRFEKKHPFKNWNELTDTEKKDFILITVKDYMFKKILHPDNNEKTQPTDRAKNKVKKIQEKIDTEITMMHKPLRFIDDHNEEMRILKKVFYNPSASREENYESYLELCKHHSQFFPSLVPPSFEEWLQKPLSLFEMRECYKCDSEHNDSQNSEYSKPISKVLILEEVLKCILKELNISIDFEGIKHCLEITNNLEYLDYEKLGNSPQEIDIAASLIKLREHDFIKKEG